MQDTISYSNPAKRYAGKHFLLHSLDEVYNRYILQPEYHKNGMISKSTMCAYKPKYVILAGNTPLNQCLCDYCENCDLIIKALNGIRIMDLPGNKYVAVNSTLCIQRESQFGTHYEFAPHQCIMHSCEMCGEQKLKQLLESNSTNRTVLAANRQMTWHKWQTVKGKSAPQKC